MFRVTKRFTFEAAHQLGKGYVGKCAHLHGHSYKVEITVEGAELNSVDMLIDFSLLKKIATDKIVSKYDHTFLNESLAKRENVNSTAEVTAKKFFDTLKDFLESNYPEEWSGKRIARVAVWETEDSYAEYFE